MANNPSILTIEGQEKIAFTGVESVNGFSESAVSLTVNGKKVLITGSKLKVLSFSKGNGNFSAVGEISAVRFGGAKGKGLKGLLR